MKIITIARKPLSESNVASNVLKHGCGAIDIDSCRIESGTEHHRPPQPTNQERSVFGKQAAFTPTNSNLGRWPPNLALIHKAGCELVGVKRVTPRGSTARPSSLGGGMFFEQGSVHSGFREADGKETVEDWRCEEGCPVRELDASSIWNSGKSSPTISVSDIAGASRFFPQFNHWNCEEGCPAARFFKQFKVGE